MRRALRPGDSIAVGSVLLTVRATPGHRPEHLALVLSDRERDELPLPLLSGDALLVGEVGRPDLAVDPRERAEALYAALHGLDDLDDAVEVWPGHIGGSLCGGASLSHKPSSTLGYERCPTRISRSAMSVHSSTASSVRCRRGLPRWTGS